MTDTPESNKAKIAFTSLFAGDDAYWVPFIVARKLERERNAMREWIMQAAPMLSVASCIVIDAAVERLGEIEGCRGVLELCPVDFLPPENV